MAGPNLEEIGVEEWASPVKEEKTSTSGQRHRTGARLLCVCDTNWNKGGKSFYKRTRYAYVVLFSSVLLGFACALVQN